MPFVASSDVLPLNLEDEDPLFNNMNMNNVQVIKINTFKFFSDQLVECAELPQAIDISDDITPVVAGPIIIEVKGVAYDNAGALTDQACSQFDNGANATVTNLLVYLHDYKAFDHKFKCPVKLTGAISSDNVYPLGE